LSDEDIDSIASRLLLAPGGAEGLPGASLDLHVAERIIIVPPSKLGWGNTPNQLAHVAPQRGFFSLAVRGRHNWASGPVNERKSYLRRISDVCSLIYYDNFDSYNW
jgi:hypothetical protein